MNYKITLLPGDGIGTEIMESAKQVLKAIEKKYEIIFQFKEELFGGASIDRHGIPLTDETIQTCYDSDAVLLGAVGGYQWESLQHHLKPEAGLLKLRKSLELFCNIRPAKVYTGLLDGSSLKKDVLSGTDFVVFRELTFNTAETRKKQLMSVDKANVLECSQYWRQVVQEVDQDYPEITLQNMYVDNAAMQIVRDPKQFDVILTSNLFGDILSDIAGMITGSLGMLPSASLGEKYALYEPVHGSAPDIAGQNKANPIAMIASVAMMLEHSFKMNDAAKNIETAIEETLESGYRTADIFDKGETLVTTSEMTEKILANME